MNYINVPVPEYLVPEVMALIVSRTKGAPDATKGAAEQPVTADSDWTEVDLRKLWRESGSPVRTTMQLLATNAGKPVSGQEIAEALGKADRGHAIAGMMGALGRRLKHRHGGRWPFSAQWNAVGELWQYTMPSAVAAIIEQIAAEDAVP